MHQRLTSTRANDQTASDRLGRRWFGASLGQVRAGFAVQPFRLSMLPHDPRPGSAVELLESSRARRERPTALGRPSPVRPRSCKRRTIGPPSTRRREWILDINYAKRRTFAYACEVYSRILELSDRRAERRVLLAEFERRPKPTDSMDADEYVDVLCEAVPAGPAGTTTGAPAPRRGGRSAVTSSPVTSGRVPASLSLQVASQRRDRLSPVRDEVAGPTAVARLAWLDVLDRESEGRASVFRSMSSMASSRPPIVISCWCSMAQ
jgi:hypothetical protein